MNLISEANMLQTIVTKQLEADVRALRDEQQVIDALYRFAAGQDLRRRELFLSAFSVDAELDFTQPARRFGIQMPIMIGRSEIAKIMEILAPLDTTHTVTNPRVELHGDEARLTALVEAQHVSRAAPEQYLLLKNIYDVTLVRSAVDWKIRSLGIRNVWYQGDPGVLFDPQTVLS
jgi:hypothetical protein